MKYKDMSYIDFLENVLGVKLTDEQKIMLGLFEENKKKITYNPILLTSIDYNPPWIYCKCGKDELKSAFDSVLKDPKTLEMAYSIHCVNNNVDEVAERVKDKIFKDLDRIGL